MTTVILCAVRDNAIEAFNNPICVPHVGQAMRGFTDEVQRKDSEVARHAADYELWKIGEMDVATGKITGEPTRLVRALDLLVKES